MGKFNDLKEEVEIYGTFIELQKDRSITIDATRDGFFQSFDSFVELSNKIETAVKEDKINFFGIHLTNNAGTTYSKNGNFYSLSTSKKNSVLLKDIETAKELSYLGNPVKMFDNKNGLGLTVSYSSDKGGEIAVTKFENISAKKQKVSISDYTKDFASLGWNIKEIDTDKKTDAKKETAKKSFLR